MRKAINHVRTRWQGYSQSLNQAPPIRLSHRSTATAKLSSHYCSVLLSICRTKSGLTKETPQFGLIAEEVAKVNPALVLPDKEGNPYTVRCDVVNAMLLNEFLKGHRTVQEQRATIAQLEQELVQQRTQIEALASGLEKSAHSLKRTTLRRKWSTIPNEKEIT
jgi:hypothetical protein